MIGEFMLILVINYIGILISTVLHFPLPGTITALLLLFLLLQFKVLKLEKIENAANFLLLNMTLFFMPPTVKIIDSYDLLEKDNNYSYFYIFNYGNYWKSCSNDDRL